MTIGWVWLVFGVGAVLLALAAFPHLRYRFVATLRSAFGRARQTQDRWASAAHAVGRVAVSGTTHRASNWSQQARSHWRWGALVVALLLLPAAGTWWWGQWHGRALDAFDDRIDPSNHQVANLLLGEQLVPPAPLPPDIFATVEVDLVHPMLSSADRRWDQMDAAFVQRLLLVFKIMHEEHGYDMALLEGYRSPERQNMLAAKGSQVTQAKAWQSYHQYGLASDCAFLRAGKLVISEKDPWALRGYELYGQVAEQVGLTWGGRWQMLDLGHVEWRKPGVKTSP